MMPNLKEWVRQMLRTKTTSEDPRHADERERAAVKQEIAKGLHDAAARLHVLEWQADVEGRRRRQEQESG